MGYSPNMADTPETPEPNIPGLRADIEAIGKRLEALEAQARSNGGMLSALDQGLGNVLGRLDTHRDALTQIHRMVTDVSDTVREAAPLLQSRAAKALRAGGSVIDYLKAGRSA